MLVAFLILVAALLAAVAGAAGGYLLVRHQLDELSENVRDAAAFCGHDARLVLELEERVSDVEVKTRHAVAGAARAERRGEAVAATSAALVHEASRQGIVLAGDRP